MGERPTDDPRDGDSSPKQDDNDFADVRQRLDSLETKLDARRPNPAKERAEKADRSQFGMAVRVSSDFIAAIFVGGALGWFLDSFAGTSPFGLVILLLLGFAAGVLNVMRTLGLVALPKGMSAPPPSPNTNGSTARRHDTEK